MFARVFAHLNRPYYAYIPFGLLTANWVFQRILRRNADIPCSVHFTSSYLGAKNIFFSDECCRTKASFAVSGGCFFTAFEGTTISIGHGTLWACNVCVQTGNHDYLERDKYACESVAIGRNCWIGFGAVILAGVVLGDNVTVGANAVVTRSFPANVVIAGSPAKVIREIA